MSGGYASAGGSWGFWVMLVHGAGDTRGFWAGSGKMEVLGEAAGRERLQVHGGGGAW